MVNPTVLLLSATLVLIGFMGLVAFGMYLAFRFINTVTILKAAPDAKAAAALLRATGGDKPASKPLTAEEKIAMEMPATGIEELADNPEAITNLRKKQDPVPDPY